MEVTPIVNWNQKVHHREVKESVIPLSLHSIQKWSVGKNVKNRLFQTDTRPPLFIVVSKLTQVLGGLQIMET